MSTELHAPNGRHNHPPRCCCSPDDMGRGIIICPVCPEHGELAPTVECPQCHQPAGRPHTDYCPLQLREEVFAGTCTCDMARSEPLDHRPGQHHMPGCPMRIDPLGRTSQPATRTSQPTTEVRTGDFLEGARTRRPTCCRALFDDNHPQDMLGPHHEPSCRRYIARSRIYDEPGNGQFINHVPTPHPRIGTCTPSCNNEPTPLATPTPGVCTSCGQDYDETPADCATPERHDHPR